MSQYNDEFYDTIAAGCRSSAAAVVPVVMDLLRPSSVVDFGCGQGYWLEAWRTAGAEIHGYDGAYVDQTRLAIPAENFHSADLSVQAVIRPCDLAMSLEVAEHLPAHVADRFVCDLCVSADRVLFSAAIPAQGGTGHVNEQWPAYWVEKFANEGFIPSTILRDMFWDDGRVEPWYSQNALIFGKTSTIEETDIVFDPRWTTVRPVVHPVFWQSRVIG